jgi:hypothetical protein
MAETSDTSFDKLLDLATAYRYCEKLLHSNFFSDKRSFKIFKKVPYGNNLEFYQSTTDAGKW